MNFTINANTRLNKALEMDPRVLGYIVSLNPGEFQRLHNPFMRRLMSPRISLGRIATMTHTPIAELLATVSALTGAAIEEGISEGILARSPKEPPAWVMDTHPDTVKEVNLLPMDQSLDQDPMVPVAMAVKTLAPGGVICIRHRWEPQPLYDVWAKMDGIEWYAAEISPDEWNIWVRRAPRDSR
ncbi:MAG TPA: DUF2249 domain-containing protein [Terriglobia bacterium]|nr:DUF2249 domain-containing protein [Terriglobia bacterium]